MVDFVAKFLPQTVSLELGYASSANRAGESLVGTSAMIEVTPELSKVLKEPPRLKERLKLRISLGSLRFLRNHPKLINPRPERCMSMGPKIA